MNNFIEGQFDAVVVGAGHAGCEAALALARTGLNTAVITLNLDSIAALACNPSIGGTAKGHLVREIDALGGEIGVNADKTLLQLRMLNRGKGAAVHSLRAQTDKFNYHTQMKKTLENTQNLQIFQAEVAKILHQDGKVCGVATTAGGIFYAKAVILCTGVYLKARIITGEHSQNMGPNGFAPANELTQSLIDLGFNVRRFKTGTPARIDARSINYNKCQIQEGEKNIYSFSFMTTERITNQLPCYLTYTNTRTHQIIKENLHRSPLYAGDIKGVGARYCPSIEDKVVRFADKERHQIFLEPEGANTNEVYVQGLSTSLPHDVQKSIYQSVDGLENCKIMRYAYAIEYDAIDTLDLLPTLEYKKIEGLYAAGQINGTSGYEEAAAQGLMAGLNASLKHRQKPPFVLDRSQAYIGVLIDDLVTKGTNEPYRMMTSRAEHRISLRQDNADFRLTELGYNTGLVTKDRYAVYSERKQMYIKAMQECQNTLLPKQANSFILKYGGGLLNNKISFKDMIKRGIALKDIMQEFGVFENLPFDILETIETEIMYEGYLIKQNEQIERLKKLEEKLLPNDINYLQIEGLRIEARQKLDKIRPQNLGQAGRISGVTPADIAVLMVYIKKTT